MSRRTYFSSSLRTRSILCSASLIAAARLARVTPVFLLPSPNSISHRHPAPSNKRTTENLTPLYSMRSCFTSHNPAKSVRLPLAGSHRRMPPVCSLVHLTKSNLSQLRLPDHCRSGRSWPDNKKAAAGAENPGDGLLRGRGMQPAFNLPCILNKTLAGVACWNVRGACCREPIRATRWHAMKSDEAPSLSGALRDETILVL